MKKVFAALAVVAVAFAGGIAFGAFVLNDDEQRATPARSPSPSPSPEPSPDPTASATAAPTVAARCSAANLSATPAVQPRLPVEVAELRRNIVQAAVDCDYRGLEQLALAGDGNFTYSFGAADSPSAYWRRLERGRGPDAGVLALLVETLNAPFCVERFDNGDGDETVMYQWPSAFCAGAEDEDWRAVEHLYPPDTLEQMRDRSGGFVGWRIGITEEGDWQFYVAGD